MSSFYHVTTAVALFQILNEGLQPRIGPRSQALGEPAPAIYAFSSLDDCMDATWIESAFAEDDELVIIEFAADRAIVDTFAPWEKRFDTPVPVTQILRILDEAGAPLAKQAELLTLAKARSSWSEVLETDRDIAAYVAEHSPHRVDEDFIADDYLNCHARLRLVPLADLTEGPADGNVPSSKKEAAYLKKSPFTMPPLLAEANLEIRDGNHRYRVACKQAMPAVWCYVAEEGTAPTVGRSKRLADCSL